MLKKIPKWLKVLLSIIIILACAFGIWIAYLLWQQHVQSKQERIFNMLTYDAEQKVYREITFKFPVLGYSLDFYDKDEGYFFSMHAKYPNLGKQDKNSSVDNTTFILVSSNTKHYDNKCNAARTRIINKNDAYVKDKITNIYTQYSEKDGYNLYYHYNTDYCLISENNTYLVAKNNYLFKKHEIIGAWQSLHIEYFLSRNDILNFPDGIPAEHERIKKFLQTFIVSDKVLADKQTYKHFNQVIDKE
jgi:predicted outer membrane lipoprotein